MRISRALILSVMACLPLAGCYYDPGYGYVRNGSGADAYYGEETTTTVVSPGYSPGYGYGYDDYGYGAGCCYSGVTVGTVWYDAGGRRHYRDRDGRDGPPPGRYGQGDRRPPPPGGWRGGDDRRPPGGWQGDRGRGDGRPGPGGWRNGDRPSPGNGANGGQPNRGGSAGDQRPTPPQGGWRGGDNRPGQPSSGPRPAPTPRDGNDSRRTDRGRPRGDRD